MSVIKISLALSTNLPTTTKLETAQLCLLPSSGTQGMCHSCHILGMQLVEVAESVECKHPIREIGSSVPGGEKPLI